MISSKNVKVSQKRCLGTSIESFTGSSSLAKQIGKNAIAKMMFNDESLIFHLRKIAFPGRPVHWLEGLNSKGHNVFNPI